jgi:hypothetical protein
MTIRKPERSGFRMLTVSEFWKHSRSGRIDIQNPNGLTITNIAQILNAVHFNLKNIQNPDEKL